MKRLQSAYDIKDECIKVVDEGRFLFSVKSQDVNCLDLWYNISFGNEETMPCCDCMDWERNRLPCKHFLAVFSHYANCGFNQLPSIYKDSPFLTLDQDVIFQGNAVPSFKDTQGQEDMELSAIPAVSESTASKLTPTSSETTKQQDNINWGAKCKEGVKQITSLLHVVDDNDTLKEAYSFVTSCIEVLNRTTSKEEGLILENNGESKTSNSSCSKNYGQKKCLKTKRFKDLPKAKRKDKQSGRVGIRAEALKRNLTTTIEDTADQQHKTAKKMCSTVIETELAPFDLLEENKI